MSFLSALFGRLAPASVEKIPEPVDYKGFIIRAAPYRSEGQYQTAGTIEREIGGVHKEHRFIRADAFACYPKMRSPCRSMICRALLSAKFAASS